MPSRWRRPRYHHQFCEREGPFAVSWGGMTGGRAWTTGSASHVPGRPRTACGGSGRSDGGHITPRNGVRGRLLSRRTVHDAMVCKASISIHGGRGVVR